MTKRLFMIAGPNGAGKTTTASALFISDLGIHEFINADEIARGLAPLHPESVALTASKLMLKRLKELLAENKSFAFESTAAGTNYVKYLKEAKTKEYEINLIFLWLTSSDLAKERVSKRVMQGGHHIPENVIERRYFLGLRNLFNFYLPLADNVMVLDNSLTENKIIARKESGKELFIEDKEIWNQVLQVKDESFKDKC